MAIRKEGKYVCTLDQNISDDEQSSTTYTDCLEADVDVEEEGMLLFDINRLNKVLDILSPKDRRLLECYYGLNSKEKLSQREIANIFGLSQSYISRKIISILQKLQKGFGGEITVDNQKKQSKKVGAKKKYNTIYEYFFEYSKEKIDSVIDTLEDKDKELLHLRYGNDLNSPSVSQLDPKNSKLFYGRLIPLLKRRLSDKNTSVKTKEHKKRHNTIYEYFKDYSKEDVNIAIDLLDSSDKELIKLRYGDDLDNPDTSIKMSKEDAKDFYFRVVRKIKYRLTHKDISVNHSYDKHHTLYSIFKDYSKEEVDNIIDTLDESEKHLLYLKYGNDLNTLSSNDVFSNEQRTAFYSKLIPKIKRRLLKIKENGSFGNSRKYNTIYDFFHDYSKEEIDDVIDSLDQKEKKLLYLRYGNDLSNPNIFISMDKDDRIDFYNCVIPKMRRMLRNNGVLNTVISKMKYNTLYDYFKEYPKEDVDTIINTLDEDEKQLIYRKYGRDLCSPSIESKFNKKENSIFYGRIISKIKRRLESLYNPKKNHNSLYDYFSEYTREEIDKAVDILNEKEKQLLQFKYGSNSCSTGLAAKLNKEQSVEFYGRLIPKIKRVLLNNRSPKMNSKTIYNYFADYTKEEIDKVLDTLSEKEKQLLYLKYGSDLSSLSVKVKLNKEQNNAFYGNLIPKIKRKLLNNCNPNKKKKIKTESKSKKIRKPSYNKLKKVISTREAMVVALKLGYANNRCYSTEEVSSLLGMSKMEVINITKNALLTYRYSLTKDVDELIDSIDGEILSLK